MSRPSLAPVNVCAFVLASFFACACSPPAARAEDAPDTSLARLTPTSSPPWNPPRPVPTEQPWELVARAPGRIASLPLVLFGQAMKAGLIFTEENDIVPKMVARVSFLLDYGIVAQPASLGDRTGWGGEIGINPPFFRSLIASASGSTRGYDRERVTIETRAGFLEYRADWRPSEPFFGIGVGARAEDASDFAMQAQRARLELRYPFRQPPTRTHEILEDPAASTETHAPPRHLFRVWAGPRDVILLNGREHAKGRLPLATRFPALAASELEERVEHFVYGAQASYDRRSGRPHWWKGWRAAASGERFDQPLRAFAFHSASTPSVAFTRWTYEGEAGVSFWRDPRTFRLSARVEDQSGVGGPGVFLLPDFATLGGHEGLSGFEPGRFRDADLALARLTYIFPIVRYLETDLHVESGTVTGDLHDARLQEAKTSYGVALRLRNAFAPLASFGMDWSREKARFRFALGGVE
ncbi:MAG: hypothetical protein E6K80_05550 [Candidatus Eisenbacteria bacterium]|uniref:Bacterial surface antigen (D15) domain-containing protein n=1 Tax=Eiseniibacteriota bacterium TaxID=2212470 RepID=A0A538U6W2_UNCEI|nr:MAG: hypothetical protein E6K80_05550 [Candidatus Eisenbacteria bacterium]